MTAIEANGGTGGDHKDHVPAVTSYTVQQSPGLRIVSRVSSKNAAPISNDECHLESSPAIPVPVCDSNNGMATTTIAQPSVDHDLIASSEQVPEVSVEEEANSSLVVSSNSTTEIPNMASTIAQPSVSDVVPPEEAVLLPLSTADSVAELSHSSEALNTHSMITRREEQEK
ncbi:hypothetical protein V6N11_024593 [Hibiscus sabdariffa]|uniref:Uncharacterized protein n=1 Tax=Hibiscus sabdariffa TaxID=183260 RepID=A0ABR2QML5_9ROSI